ncbi:MAG TPA: FtsX-like permease family protein [Candidatus Saccharimonadales bacterium]|nr:FtsX-like permease family protein [Candidatus Saccharimonadales bacterium]
MKFLDLVNTANRNLTRSKLRTLLTILAIFVGGFTLTLTSALNTGVNDYLNRQLGSVNLPGAFEVVPKTEFNPFSTDISEYNPDKKVNSIQQSLTASMDLTDVAKFEDVADVEDVVPYYAISAEYIQNGEGKKYQVVQINQDYGLQVDLEAGQLMGANDKNGVILPSKYLAPLGLGTANEAIGQQITLAYKGADGKIEEKKLTVDGVSRESLVTGVILFVDGDTAKQMAAAQGVDKKFSRVIVKFPASISDSVPDSELQSRIEATGNYTAASFEEQVSSTMSVVGAITAGLNVVGIIALVAASFGIINTLLMSVYERTQEIGLMKALGMSRGKVFSLFAIEAVLVGFWGSVVAVSVATGISILLNNFAGQTFLKDFDGFTLLVITPGGAAFVIVLIMLIAFLAGTLPAIKASRLDPIEALRSE